MARPDWYPGATRRESPNGGYTVGGQPAILDPRAFVPHSADSGIMSSPPARFYYSTKPAPDDPEPGCVHFWCEGDGALTQLVRLSKPAWGNGILNRLNGHQSPLALVREWYRTRRNPNLDTISWEFTGTGHNNPRLPFTPLTEAQLAAFARFREWARAEGWLVMNQENVILHGQISATLCPDGRFTAASLLTGATPAPPPVPPPPQPEFVTRAEFEAFKERINQAVLARFGAQADAAREFARAMEVAADPAVVPPTGVSE